MVSTKIFSSYYLERFNLFINPLINKLNDKRSYEQQNQVNILNISVDNIFCGDLLQNLKKEGGFVVTPNVDHLIKLQKDPELYNVYVNADYTVCDSQILMWLSRFLGTPIKEKISGSDLLPALYQNFKNDEDIKIFLLGGVKGAAIKAQNNINAKVGRDIVIDTYCPDFGFENNEEECQKIVNLINQSGATLLAVGLGAPKQEKWIYKYRNQMPKVKIFLAIGAAIHFESGFASRAPKWISHNGLEWLYRLLSEPHRLWKRYLVESWPFFWLILQQKLGIYNYQPPIGLTLQSAGLLTTEQLNLTLENKLKYPHLRFGELLVQQNFLQQKTVDFFAEKLWTVNKQKETYPFGRYFEDAGLLDGTQIKIIIEEQKYTSLRFGEIALAKGWTNKETRDFFLKYQLNG